MTLDDRNDYITFQQFTELIKGAADNYGACRLNVKEKGNGPSPAPCPLEKFFANLEKKN